MRSMKLRMRSWIMLASMGGTTLVLDTCNPAVRDTVLGGVEAASTSLTTTLIQAFFEGLAEDEENPVI
ncbi:MAG: hypothetical protein SF069_04110 [Phycisphaerae bacterium]|nr:hypothetical protein [Phycisphaerae bacterium]